MCVGGGGGGSKSHGSNAHEIWTRGSTFHGGPFLYVYSFAYNFARFQELVETERLRRGLDYGTY